MRWRLPTSTGSWWRSARRWGRPKVDVLRQRLLDINPHLHIEACCRYLEAGDVETLLDGGFDFGRRCHRYACPQGGSAGSLCAPAGAVISSMGAGARLDPAAVAYADISKTSRCGLAREVRRRLRAAGIERGVAVVYSTEEPVASAIRTVEGERNKRSVTGTVSYLPALFGCYLAAHVIRNYRKHDRDTEHTQKFRPARSAERHRCPHRQGRDCRIVGAAAPGKTTLCKSWHARKTR